MGKLKVLITGGEGLLATELKKIMPGIYLSRKELDITNEENVRKVMKKYNPTVTLHLAAYTDVLKAETDEDKCFDINVGGTRNMAKYSKYLIYMSTEYVFNGERGSYKEDDECSPVNIYSYSKYWGELEARYAKKYCIIRTLFKPRPFKHKNVCEDMYTSGGYVDEIAPEIAFAVKNYKILPKVINIGFKRISLVELAKQSIKKVNVINSKDLKVKLPKDTSLDCSLWRKLKYATTT